MSKNYGIIPKTFADNDIEMGELKTRFSKMTTNIVVIVQATEVSKNNNNISINLQTEVQGKLETWNK